MPQLLGVSPTFAAQKLYIAGMQRMSAEYFFSRVWVVVSVMGVLVAIFLSYVNFPEDVAVHHQGGKAVTFWNKNNVFYAVVGTVVGFNVLLMFLGRTFASLPDGAVRWFSFNGWLQARPQLNLRFANWVRLLQGGLNLVVCLGLYALAMVNQPETQKTINNYQWMLWVAAFGVLLGLFWLPLRLLFWKPKPLAED